MNLNSNAVKIAREMLGSEEELLIYSTSIEEATVIDCGVKALGSEEAGVLFVKACMGGLADVSLSKGELGLLQVEVATEYPALACFGAQKTGWRLAEGDYHALASGPARILARKPKDTYLKLGYTEKADEALIAIEAGDFPPPALVERIAQECGLRPENLFILIARTASFVGSLQISARAAETALFKLNRLGYDINKLMYAHGVAPVAPIVGDDSVMMGITNDMIIYGSRVELTSPMDVDASKIPSSNSPAYGKPFGEIFKEAGYDFYKIDPDLFAPAEVHYKNTWTGKASRAGKVNLELVKRSAGIK